MRNIFSQISLFDIYADISDTIRERNISFFDLIDEHLDLYSLILDEFYRAFYKYSGRKRIYFLESLIYLFFLQKIIGIDTDSAMLRTISRSKEFRDFFGFVKVLDASKTLSLNSSSYNYLVKFYLFLI